MEEDLQLLKVEYLSNHQSKQNFTIPSNEDNLQRKMTSNIKIGVLQQPLVGSFLNLKLKLNRPNKTSQQPYSPNLKVKHKCTNQTSQMFQKKTTFIGSGISPQI